MKNLILSITLIGVLAGCSQSATDIFRSPLETHDLSEAQSCAVGYDLSKQIYEHVSLRQTTLIPSKKNKNACEKHMERYLMKAGYRLDSSLEGEGMRIEITQLDHSSFEARATITGGLVISRKYQKIRGGVRALSAPSIIKLPQNANNKVL